MSGDDDRATRVEKQLAAAQQITHLGSWEWDVATNAVTWSDELYRIYGFEPQSRPITFEFFLSRLHPDDRARVQREVGLALERGSRFAYPERIIRPDGSMRLLDTIGEASRDAEGRVIGLIGTCRDVTDEHARDETIRLYADIVRNMQIGVAVFEVEGPQTFRLFAYNPEAERAANLPLANLVGKTLDEILPYSVGGPLPRLLAEVARDGAVREVLQDRPRDPLHEGRAVSLKAFPLPGARVGLAVDDVTTQTRIQRVQDAAHRVLERIVAGEPLPEVLTALVNAIEENVPGVVGVIELLDARGGSSLTIASAGAATRLSGRTASSAPILATNGRRLGTLSLHSPPTREVTEQQRATLVRAAYLSGLAIERSQMEEQLRELSAHVELVREDERTGIAREIHDQLGQALTALKLDLAWLTRRLARITDESSGSEMTLLDKLQAMSDMTDGIIDQVRRISAELRPGVLDDLGLLAALEWQGDEFEKRTGVTCAIASNLGDAPVDRALATAIFRIFQEALTNITRHAKASHVAVRLDRRGDRLHLEVDDDGTGISPDAAQDPRSLGLLGMRERARRLGGAAEVRPGREGGTTVHVEVPLGGRSS